MKCIHSIIAGLRIVDPNDALVPIEGGKIFWHIDEKYLTRDMKRFKVILAFEKAFSAWQKYFNPIRFESTSDQSKAAIIIRFMNNKHKELPYKFEEETLAYAFYPEKESFGIESDVYFNDAYEWADMHKDENVNLWKVAVHELGHAFVLDHSSNIRDIMYPTYQPDDSVFFSKDTRKAIEKLYGNLKESYRIMQEDEGGSSVKKFLLKVFPSYRELARLSELQILRMGKLLSVDVSDSLSRTENARRIFLELKDE